MKLTTLEHLKQSGDFTKERLNNGALDILLMYLSSMTDDTLIRKEIVHPFQSARTAEDFAHILSSMLTGSKLKDETELLEAIYSGHAIILFNDAFYKIKVAKSINDKPKSATAETTLQGPQLGFSEDVDTNLLLIRKRYPQKRLVAEKLHLGKLSKTPAYLVYDSDKVDREALKLFRDKLQGIDVDVIQAVGQVDAVISGTRFRWFPTLVSSERPDRVTHNLAQGKIVLMLDGTPFCLIGPAVFYDFISAMDDVYQPFVISRSLVILRYIGIALTVLLPALYVAIVSYNPEIFRVQFALSIAGSRAAVPYPSFIEVTIMLFLIEALIEASLRLPRYIGSTATTVGGLILGQAAQQAGLVSSIMIIITSVVAISNFLIPINTMSFALRVAKYPLIMLAAFFGIAGLVTGIYAIGIYAANLQSFGKPYFRLFLGEPAISGYKEGDPY